MLADGSALPKFAEWITAQGGDACVVDESDLMPRAPIVRTVTASEDGYLNRLDAREVGLAAVELGAGRRKKGDAIDLAVGIVVHHKVGDKVEKGTPLLSIHAQSDAAAEGAAERLLEAVTIESVGQLAPPPVLDLIRGS